MYCSYDNKHQRRCHFTAAGRNCMTRRQALAATASKIIQTVLLCLTWWKVLIIAVCAIMRLG